MLGEEGQRAVDEGLQHGEDDVGAAAGLCDGGALDGLDGRLGVEDVRVDEGDDVGGEEGGEELRRQGFAHGDGCDGCCLLVVFVCMYDSA